jgi:uncharacterized protein
MLFDLTRMHEPVEHVERVFPGAAFDAGDDFVVEGQVSLVFDIAKDRDRYRLVGRVEATLDLTCSRCLERYPVPVASDFDLRYLPQSANVGEGELEVAEEDLSTAFYEHDVIDLGQLVREQFYLALPMKPLCRPDCLGLCPVCGANRNLEPCGCASGWVDPRWSELARLRTRGKD